MVVACRWQSRPLQLPLRLLQLLVLVVCSSLVVVSVAAFVPEPPTNPTGRTHFAKAVTPDIYTGGRLTTRRTHYLQLDGFRSIISLFNLTRTHSWMGVDGDWPSADEEVALGRKLNMPTVVMNWPDTLSAASLQEFASTLNKLPKPVYVHCHVGYTATLFALVTLAQSGAVTARDVIDMQFGWDYVNNAHVNKFITTMLNTQIPAPKSTPTIETHLTKGESSYQHYYWDRYSSACESYYVMGQMLNTQLASIATAGYTAVVNFRLDGEPTNRLPSEPEGTPLANNEFSDAHGRYDEAAEGVAVRARNMTYVHLPLAADGSDYTPAMFHKYRASILMAAAPRSTHRSSSSSSSSPFSMASSKASAVLVKCRSGQRAAAFLLPALALDKNAAVVDGNSKGPRRGVQWCLDRAREMGFAFAHVAPVMALWRTVLGEEGAAAFEKQEF